MNKVTKEQNTEKKIVKTWCEYENIEHKNPPCVDNCHNDCKYMLIMYEDGYAIFGNEKPKNEYEKP